MPNPENVVAQAQSPQKLPIVQKCVQKLQQDKNAKPEEAQTACMRILRKKGRIRQTDQGWVEYGPQQGQGGQRQQAQPAQRPQQPQGAAPR